MPHGCPEDRIDDPVDGIAARRCPEDQYEKSTHRDLDRALLAQTKGLTGQPRDEHDQSHRPDVYAEQCGQRVRDQHPDNNSERPLQAPGYRVPHGDLDRQHRREGGEDRDVVADDIGGKEPRQPGGNPGLGRLHHHRAEPSERPSSRVRTGASVVRRRLHREPVPECF